ncbi:hypothetical protein AOB46_07590 [Chryseobacterium indologenes]|uniref:Uncharacterized protein n=1 Tax=Chryseobacterium indologenes TaxID=253 RepID=A0A0N0IX89_CHRID|nr:hypothetical protein AOB46_07590 [Chryseobacterium indologenes]
MPDIYNQSLDAPAFLSRVVFLYFLKLILKNMGDTIGYNKYIWFSTVNPSKHNGNKALNYLIKRV